MDEADHYSDKIAIIDKGRTVKLGTAGELKQSIRSEVIKLSFGNGGVEDCLLKKIKGMSFVSEVITCNSKMEVIVDDVETALPYIVDILRTGDVSITRISTVRPTLDDAFLKYVGSTPVRDTVRQSQPPEAAQR